mmetsp:Transcript_16430/g.49018  ORF Transcript_16430/g.49018 Transcript_16430/m.49018 type:complete len:214 (+) Transcript_16430:594-1235(+)
MSCFSWVALRSQVLPMVSSRSSNPRSESSNLTKRESWRALCSGTSLVTCVTSRSVADSSASKRASSCARVPSIFAASASHAAASASPRCDGGPLFAVALSANSCTRLSCRAAMSRRRSSKAVAKSWRTMACAASDAICLASVFVSSRLARTEVASTARRSRSSRSCCRKASNCSATPTPAGMVQACASCISARRASALAMRSTTSSALLAPPT